MTFFFKVVRDNQFYRAATMNDPFNKFLRHREVVSALFFFVWSCIKRGVWILVLNLV
jgi:hypothetical protein